MLKITLLMNLMIAVLASPTVHEWHHFKRLHGKQYSSPSEDLLRMQVYMDNKMMIDEHNRRFSLGLESFSMKLNHFADMTEHEFHNLYLGLNSSATLDSSLGGSTFLPPENAGDLPKHVDWRLKGAVTPVKNQGDCGSCWAFSATGALEAQVYRKTKQLISLSEQNLLDCSSYNEFGNIGCEGGLMTNAFRYILDNGGVDTEESYPYEEMVQECRYDQEKVGASMSGFVNVRQDDERELALAVANVGPVSGGIDASRIGFRFYDSGVFYTPDCDNVKLNHAILIVGYGTEFGQDYWLVKNSWGESWGDGGYIKMARNRDNHCGIAKITSYPLV